MRMKAAYLAGAVTLLAGCETAEKAVDDAAWVTAKATVEKVLTAHLPGGIAKDKVTPYSDCVIDNASANELFKLSRASVTGVDDQTIGLVTEIIQRPATTKCIGEAALGLAAS